MLSEDEQTSQHEALQSAESDSWVTEDEQPPQFIEQQIQPKTEQTYEPINKVMRRKISDNGEVLYYVNWKNNRSKKYNSWVKEQDLSRDLKMKLANRKWPTKKGKICTIETQTKKQMIKIINTKEDWFSFYFNFENPIIKTFCHKNVPYEFHATSMNSLYIYYQYLLTGETHELVHWIENNLNNKWINTNNLPNYWPMISTWVLYITIIEAMKNNTNILDKLDETNQVYIEEKSLGITVYTTMLMLIREQRRIESNLTISVDISILKNPVASVYGNIKDKGKENYLLYSPFRHMSACSTDLRAIDIDQSFLCKLLEIENNM